MTKEYLKSKKIDYNEISIADHEEAAEMIVEKTGQFGVPVVQIGDDFIVGFDEKEIGDFLNKHALLKDSVSAAGSS